MDNYYRQHMKMMRFVTTYGGDVPTRAEEVNVLNSSACPNLSWQRFTQPELQQQSMFFQMMIHRRPRRTRYLLTYVWRAHYGTM